MDALPHIAAAVLTRWDVVSRSNPPVPPDPVGQRSVLGHHQFKFSFAIIPDLFPSASPPTIHEAGCLELSVLPRIGAVALSIEHGTIRSTLFDLEDFPFTAEIVSLLLRAVHFIRPLLQCHSYVC